MNMWMMAICIALLLLLRSRNHTNFRHGKPLYTEGETGSPMGCKAGPVKSGQKCFDKSYGSPYNPDNRDTTNYHCFWRCVDCPGSNFTPSGWTTSGWKDARCK